jgi:hypothetical protein
VRTGCRLIQHCTHAALAVALLASTGTAEQPSCAKQPTLVGSCFTVHGRASLYNGNPSARIWKIGTHRVLGISESRCIEPECSQMPAELRKMLSWEEAVVGDFLVCPFTEAKPEHMQFVCVEAAKNLRAHKLK